MEETPLTMIEELRSLARVAEHVNVFDLDWDGITVHVVWSPGTSAQLTLSVPYDAVAKRRESGEAVVGGYRDGARRRLRAIRPMLITLTVETPAHRDAKELDGDVEYQTGDPRFDDAVYIDAPSQEPLGVVLGSEVARRAVLELFKLELTAIVIDDERGLVTARCTSFPKLTLESHDHGRRAATAFAELVKNLPPVVASGAEHPRDPLAGPTKLFTTISLVLFILGPPVYFGFMSTGRCDAEAPSSDCYMPGVVGLVVAFATALVLAFVMRPMLRARFGGTSSSSRRINALVLSASFTAFMVVALATVWILRVWQ